jgi:hypothetical protein
MTAAPDRIPTSQLIMQYLITLSADYDMTIIRERVRARGSALDNRAGLVCKAYCICKAGVLDSPVNEYAPFYLWGDADAAADFLWRGAGFDGIVHDFGHPPVRTCVPETRALGPAPTASVTHAVVRTTPVPAEADLIKLAARLTARITERGQDERGHLALASIDPTTW